MELLKKIFDSNNKARGSKDKKLSLPSEQSNLLLAGPLKSGRSSLLFECALMWADVGKKVLFISPRKITNLPSLLSNREQPSVEVLSRINIIYLENKNDFIEFMASVHVNYREVLDLVIVDDIDQYYSGEEKRNELAAQAKVLSYVADAAFYLKKLRHHYKSSEEFSECNLICAISVPHCKMIVQQRELLEHWFQDMIIIKPLKESENIFSAVMEMHHSDEELTELMKSKYSLEDGKIIILDAD